MNKSQIQNHLLNYLLIYLSKKNLKMKNVIRGIIYRLERDKKISLKQFNSIIKFLEREIEFRKCNRETITNFYSKIIVGLDYGNRNVDRSYNLEEILGE